jgi:hypothetical protein
MNHDWELSDVSLADVTLWRCRNCGSMSPYEDQEKPDPSVEIWQPGRPPLRLMISYTCEEAILHKVQEE